MRGLGFTRSPGRQSFQPAGTRTRHPWQGISRFGCMLSSGRRTHSSKDWRNARIIGVRFERNLHELAAGEKCDQRRLRGADEGLADAWTLRDHTTPVVDPERNRSSGEPSGLESPYWSSGFPQPLRSLCACPMASVHLRRPPERDGSTSSPRWRWMCGRFLLYVNV